MNPPILAAEGGAKELLGLSLGLSAILLAALPMALLAAAESGARLARILEASRTGPVRSFLVGLLAAVSVLLLAAASGTSPAFGVPAVLALATAAILVFFGLAAEARGLGARLRGRDPGPGEVDGGSVAVGWLVIAGLPLLILAGPLVLLYLVLRALGAALLVLAATSRGRSPATPPRT